MSKEWVSYRLKGDKYKLDMDGKTVFIEKEKWNYFIKEQHSHDGISLSGGLSVDKDELKEIVTSSNDCSKMKIEEESQGVPFYLSVESHYVETKDAKGKKDAVLFEMGQYPEGKWEIDSVITASVEDAREFARSILKLCDEIEK